MTNPASPNNRRCNQEKGALSSFGYPRPYVKDTLWTWEIVTELNTYIEFHILDFDVPSETTGPECYYTYLGFYDTIQAGLAGDIEDRKQYFCHRRQPTSEPVLSPFNELFVVFQSGDISPGRGFKAQYESIQFHTNVEFNSSTEHADGEQLYLPFSKIHFILTLKIVLAEGSKNQEVTVLTVIIFKVCLSDLKKSHRFNFLS